MDSFLWDLLDDFGQSAHRETARAGQTLKLIMEGKSVGEEMRGDEF